MKLYAGVAGILSALTLSPSALAQDNTSTTGISWAAGYGLIQADDGSGSSVDLGAIQFKLGYRFHPNFGIEAEGGVGVQKETVDVLGIPVELGIGGQLGAFAVGYLPVGGFDLFARAGVGSVQLQATALSASETDTQETTAFGAGAIWDLNFMGGVDLRAEYTRYEFDDSDADAFTISVGGKF